MKYIKRFNEGLTQKELSEIQYDIEDILIEIDDINIKRNNEYIHKVDIFSNFSSSIGKFTQIDVRIMLPTSHISQRTNYINSYINSEEFEHLIPVLNTLIRMMEQYTNKNEVDIDIAYWDSDDQETNHYRILYKPNNGIFTKEWFKIRIGDKDKITGLDLKFKIV